MMLIFLIVVLGIYFAGNYYVFIRSSVLLPQFKWVKIVYTIVFMMAVLSFVIFQIFERKFNMPGITGVLAWSGAIWMAVLLYSFFGFLVVDILKWVIKFSGISIINAKYTSLVKVIFPALFFTWIVILIITGYYNAVNTKVTHINIAVNKQVPQTDALEIVMVSDVHLGHIIGEKRVKKLVEIINSQNPDIVFIAGDLLDQDLKPVINADLLKHFKEIKSKYGMFAITGNHEFIGDINKTAAYIQKSGIPLLRDNAIVIDNKFVVIGRNDKDMKRFSGTDRLSYTELLKGIDTSIPVILLDHQPYHLNEVATYPVDLQLSGHTHKGQLFPFNFITSAIFDQHYGYLKLKNTHFYISSGFGTWGPPVRLGSQSEIVKITMNFIKNTD